MCILDHALTRVARIVALASRAELGNTPVKRAYPLVLHLSLGGSHSLSYIFNHWGLATKKMNLGSAERAVPIVRPKTTWWERIATSTKWGSYISYIEKKAILKGESLAGSPQRALEIGCESGRWSELLSQMGWEMTCIDVDSQSLSRCQQRLPNAKCILATPDDRSLPCDSSSASLLLCIEVDPVIDSDWFLPEAERVLTKDGILVGIFWNTFSWRGLAGRTKSALFGGTQYYHFMWMSWKKRFRAQGFEVVSEEGFCWAPFTRESNSFLVPAFTRMERELGLNRLIALSPWIAFVARRSSH